MRYSLSSPVTNKKLRSLDVLRGSERLWALGGRHHDVVPGAETICAICREFRE